MVRMGVKGLSLVVLATWFASDGPWTAAVGNAQETRISLPDAREPSRAARVKLALEARGELQGDGDSATVVPMSVSGELVYDERFFRPSQPDATSAVSSVRALQRARAKIEVGKEKDEVVLGPDKQLIAVLPADSGSPVMYSLGARLSRQEWDVLRVPCNSLVAYELLPKDTLQTGDAWPVSPTTLAAVLQLERVTDCDVRGKLVEITKGLAKIQIYGQLIGRAEGAVTEMSLAGELRYDLRASTLRWLQMRIKEDRGGGPTAPPFKVVAEIRMLIEPLSQVPQSLQAVTSPKPRPSDLLLTFTSPLGGFRVLHSQAWSIVSDHEKQTVLRLAKGRDVVAQCNLTRLPNSPAGKHLGLESFQDDIRKVLKEKFVEFEEAKQDTRKDGLRILRVVVHGKVDEGPVRWVYGHLENPQGERASYVCTLAADPRKLEAFDRVVEATFEFVQPAQASKPRQPDETAPLPR